MDKKHLEILQSIVRHPAMYWGNSANHFHSLVAFLSGYDLKGYFTNDYPRLVPDDFHEFVTQHYTGEWGLNNGKGWMTFIEENTTSDREALEEFLELSIQYENRKS